MKLYFAAGTCSLSPRIVLEEAEIVYEAIAVDMNHRYSGGNFFDINPKGYVPAIELDGGSILTEGALIVQYLADMKPEFSLIPRIGTMSRIRCLEWLTYIGTELHKGFVPLFKGGLTDEGLVKARESLTNRIAYADRQLREQTYLVDDAFSVADIYLYTVIRWADRVKLDINDFENIAAFQNRVASRPKVRVALSKEGLR